jgi:hypothetical protein
MDPRYAVTPCGSSFRQGKCYLRRYTSKAGPDFKVNRRVKEDSRWLVHEERMFSLYMSDMALLEGSIVIGMPVTKLIAHGNSVTPAKPESGYVSRVSYRPCTDTFIC